MTAAQKIRITGMLDADSRPTNKMRNTTIVNAYNLLAAPTRTASNPESPSSPSTLSSDRRGSARIYEIGDLVVAVPEHEMMRRRAVPGVLRRQCLHGKPSPTTLMHPMVLRGPMHV